MAHCGSSLVAGEEEKEVKTDSFAMNIKADNVANLEGQTLAGGVVQVPLGALAGVSSDAVVAKVMRWADAGPLFYAKDRSPAGFSAVTKLRSPVLSVTIEDGNGVELAIANLTGDPFLVILALPIFDRYNRWACVPPLSRRRILVPSGMC